MRCDGHCCPSWVACVPCLALTGGPMCSNCVPGSSTPLPDRNAAAVLPLCWHGRLHCAAIGCRPQAGQCLEAAPLSCRLVLERSPALQHLKACLPSPAMCLLSPDPVGTDLHSFLLRLPKFHTDAVEQRSAFLWTPSVPVPAAGGEAPANGECDMAGANKDARQAVGRAS